MLLLLLTVAAAAGHTSVLLVCHFQGLTLHSGQPHWRCRAPGKHLPECSASPSSCVVHITGFTWARWSESVATGIPTFGLIR